MKSVLTGRLEQLEKSGTSLTLSGVLHGLEKEGLRVNSSGSLALTPHPPRLGAALTNRYITTDFSESLLELITPVLADPAEALTFLETIHQYVYANIGDEIMWASSMPCPIDDPESIPIAWFGTSNIGQMKHIYRIGLKHRYGKMMQSIAGIHYNFSLPDEFWQGYRALAGSDDRLQSFKSASYFTLIRNFRRHSWLLLYLFGASPALSQSFLGTETGNLDRWKQDTLYLPHATSLRMSDLGYSTTAQSSINICFNQLETYTKTLTDATNTSHPDYEKIGLIVDGAYRQLSTTILQIENEYYSDIRPKRVPQPGEGALRALVNRGVEYVEVRNTDVNPLLPVGMDLEQAAFMDTFLIGCLLMGDDFISPAECKVIEDNQKNVTTRGREPGLMLAGPNGDTPLDDAGSSLINEFMPVAELLDRLHDTDLYTRSAQAQLAKLEDSSITPSAMVLKAIQDSGLEYAEWVFETSKAHREKLVKKLKNNNITEKLEMESRESIVNQARIEAADSVDFATFLKTYRTGVTESN